MARRLSGKHRDALINGRFHLMSQKDRNVIDNARGREKGEKRNVIEEQSSMISFNASMRWRAKSD